MADFDPSSDEILGEIAAAPSPDALEEIRNILNNCEDGDALAAASFNRPPTRVGNL